MFIKEFIISNRYKRVSKLGNTHEYSRNKTMVVLRCDSCSVEFIRQRGEMDPKRISNNYFHVCDKCDVKVFAQQKGVQKKQIWNIPASSDLDISKL